MSFNIGAKNTAHFYRTTLKVEETTSVFKWKSKLVTSDTFVTTPTKTDVAYAMKNIGTIKPDYSEDGTVKLDYKNYDSSEAQLDFLNVCALPAVGGKKKKDITLIDGSVRKGSVNISEMVVSANYLSYDDDDKPTKIYVLIALGAMAYTSGSMDIGGESEVTPSFVFNGITADTDLVIPLGILDDTIVDTTGLTITIAEGRGFWRGYIPLKTVPVVPAG